MPSSPLLSRLNNRPASDPYAPDVSRKKERKGKLIPLTSMQPRAHTFGGHKNKFQQRKSVACTDPKRLGKPFRFKQKAQNDNNGPNPPTNLLHFTNNPDLSPQPNQDLIGQEDQIKPFSVFEKCAFGAIEDEVEVVGSQGNESDNLNDSEPDSTLKI